MAQEQSQNGRGEYQINKIDGVLLLVEGRELGTLKPKLGTSEICTLINNFVIVLVCAKLITLEENTISVQQLP